MGAVMNKQQAENIAQRIWGQTARKVVLESLSAGQLIHVQTSDGFQYLFVDTEHRVYRIPTSVPDPLDFDEVIPAGPQRERFRVKVSD
jgi:tetraacyldisaccharide-1-P 4'-kinase